MENNSFYVKTHKGQLVNTHIQMKGETTAAVHGVVKDEKGLPIAKALVMLYETQEGQVETAVSYIESDKEGHFAFSGLKEGNLYQVRVFIGQKNIRNLVVE